LAQFTDDDSFTSWSLNPYVNDEEDVKARQEYELKVQAIAGNLAGISEVASSTGLVDVSSISPETQNLNATIFL